MLLKEILASLEKFAPLALQEDYDNCGLLCGLPENNCAAALICLDVTEEIIAEAMARGCNLVIAHHPLIFSGLKKVTGKNGAERTLIAAIKNDVAIYAIHTNLDNVLKGVNGKIAAVIGLKNCEVLQPKSAQLRKLICFAPPADAEAVREAIFKAGAGWVGNYSECSFISEGRSSFKPEPGANPAIGKIGEREEGKEFKMEFIFSPHREAEIIAAMKAAHSYEEVAYDIVSLGNFLSDTGSGLTGDLDEAISEEALLKSLQDKFRTGCIRHSALSGRPVKRIAVCGGSGSFLIGAAKAKGADAFITADLKYHEFFEADGAMLLADIGHFESEQYTIDLIYEVLKEDFPNFALLKTALNTNPVQYFSPKKS